MDTRNAGLGAVVFLTTVAHLVFTSPQTQGQEDATAMTRESNASVAQQLSFQQSDDFKDARRGFVATLPDATIRSSDGRVVWSLKDYDFLKRTIPLRPSILASGESRG